MQEEQEPTIGDLKRALANKATWFANEALDDDSPIPTYGTGASLEGMPSISAVPPVDLSALFREIPPTNPFLIERCYELGLLQNTALEVPVGTSPEESPDDNSPQPNI